MSARRLHLVVEVRDQDGGWTDGLEGVAARLLDGLHTMGATSEDGFPYVQAGEWGQHRWVFDTNPLPLPTRTRPEPEPVVMPDWTPDEVVAVKAAVRGLVHWATEVEQPANAVVSQFGRSLWPIPDRVQVGAWPGSSRGPGVLLVLTSTHWVPDPAHTGHSVQQRLAPSHVQVLDDVLEELGQPVRSRWNGPPAHTMSTLLAAGCHPTLLEANRRYHRGHPTGGVDVCVDPTPMEAT